LKSRRDLDTFVQEPVVIKEQIGRSKWGSFWRRSRCVISTKGSVYPYWITFTLDLRLGEFTLGVDVRLKITYGCRQWTKALKVCRVNFLPVTDFLEYQPLVRAEFKAQFLWLKEEWENCTQ